MDPRVIGERSDAVLRTAMPGGDGGACGDVRDPNGRSVEGACKRRDSILRFLRLGLCPPCLAQSRASSIATPDDGARCGRRQCVPPMERREAQGPSQGPVRPRKTHRLVSQTGLREPRKLPGASRRSIPLVLRGNGKQGRRVRPGARNQNHGTAKRWLKRCLSERCLLERWSCQPHNRCHARA